MSIITHKPKEQVTDWKLAMSYLEEGNARYCKGPLRTHAVSQEARDALAHGQRPFAAIVACVDSRVTPEIIFDLSLGDIIVIRNAGNVADKDTLGSLEYAVNFLNVPLIVVVGHSNCGVVAAAISGARYSENLQEVLSLIYDDVKDCEDIDDAIRANAKASAEHIRENLLIHAAGTTVLSAYYDISSGVVSFLT